MRYLLCIAVHVAIGALALFVPTRAPAVDGVVEINQVKALAGGVTAGDAAGFPVTVNAPGSYRLTSNLDVTADQHGIEITTSHVTLDLNGFTIASLGGATARNGILVPPGNTINTEIRNGTVLNFIGDGVLISNSALAFEAARVIGVRAVANGSDGLVVLGEGSRIEGCTALQNGERGIFTVDGALVLHSVARSNVGLGVTGGNFGFLGNVLSDNNGGNANPQVAGAINLGQNVCGTALCP